MNKKETPSSMRPPKRKIDFSSLKKIILIMYRSNKFATIIFLAMTLIASVAMTIGMSYFQELIDVQIPQLITQTIAAKESFTWFIVKVAATFLASAVSSATQTYVVINLCQKVMRDIKNKTFTNMQGLPISFFDTHKYGDIMSRYTNDIDTLENFITQTVPNMISSIISLLFLLVMMFINSWILTLSLLLILTIIMISTSGVMKRSGKYFLERQKVIGKTNAYIEEMIQGAKVVQTYNHQAKAIDEFNEINEQYRLTDTKANTFGNLMGPLMGNFTRIQFVIIALLGAYLTQTIEGYTIGLLVTFLNFANSFSNPVGRMAQQVNSVAEASAGSRRIFELQESPKEVDNGYVSLINYDKDEKGNYFEVDKNSHNWAWKHPHKNGEVEYVALKGDIVLDQVDFSYEEGKQVLKDINIYAKPGQKIALVGQTGAGKTTITNLINRFYDIEDGKIRYDGININKIKKQDLRRSLGLVLQDTNLFTGTIKDNIKYGKPEATDEEVFRAAEIANADSFIRMMPEGYDTVLTQAGESLSQGQRQLISIARAAIYDCPVLILDEATSSIDTRTELIVQQGMDKLMEGRTVFVIAHRLSTVQKCNVIMVMDHGEIIERGNHKELIEKKGVYYQLYTGAFELE